MSEEIRRTWIRRILVGVGILAVLWLIISLGSGKNFGPSQYLQLTLDGLRGGAIYGLVALGFVVIYNVTDIVNFAQGAFAMLGAMTAVWVTNLESLAGMSPGTRLFLAVVAGVVVATIAGLAEERLAIRPARDSSQLTLIIITIGTYIVLQGLAFIVWGGDQFTMPTFTTLEARDKVFRVGGAIIQAQSLWIWGTVAVVAIALYFLFSKTMTGRALRASATNKTAARLMGIKPGRMSMIAFTLSAAITGLGGTVLGPATRPTYDMGLIIGVKGFVAAIIGGLVNPVGAVLGGLMLGVIENIGAGVTKAGLKDIFAFVVLILVLLFKPHGLLSRRQKVEKV